MSEVTKRKVSTDALETLGTIIGDGEKRDAIHIAILPAIASERLLPGQDIGVVDGQASRFGTHVGIVDPFLKAPVEPGQRFWLLLYPRMVTSLRHVWSHPAFADDAGAPAPAAQSGEDDSGPSPYKLVNSWATIDSYAKEVGTDRGGLMSATRDFKERRRCGSCWSAPSRPSPSRRKPHQRKPIPATPPERNQPWPSSFTSSASTFRTTSPARKARST